MPLPLFFENTNETYTLIGSSAIRYYFERTKHQTREIEKPKDQYVYIYSIHIQCTSMALLKIGSLIYFVFLRTLLTQRRYWDVERQVTSDIENAWTCNRQSNFTLLRFFGLVYLNARTLDSSKLVFCPKGCCSSKMCWARTGGFE